MRPRQLFDSIPVHRLFNQKFFPLSSLSPLASLVLLASLTLTGCDSNGGAGANGDGNGNGDSLSETYAVALISTGDEEVKMRHDILFCEVGETDEECGTLLLTGTAQVSGEFIIGVAEIEGTYDRVLIGYETLQGQGRMEVRFGLHDGESWQQSFETLGVLSEVPVEEGDEDTLSIPLID